VLELKAGKSISISVQLSVGEKTAAIRDPVAVMRENDRAS
jgi:hypothetical protein